MEFLRPADWSQALAAKAAYPTALPIAGGTDVMVEINFDHRRPEYLLGLGRIAEFQQWDAGTVEGLAHYAEQRAAHGGRGTHDGEGTESGFCTSEPSDADIREALSGSLCRCTGYEKILDAVRLDASRQEEAV